MEGDLVIIPFNARFTKFQSTPSAWRETYLLQRSRLHLVHFNPLPPHGGRLNEFSCGSREPTISIHSLRMEGDQLGR